MKLTASTHAARMFHTHTARATGDGFAVHEIRATNPLFATAFMGLTQVFSLIDPLTKIGRLMAQWKDLLDKLKKRDIPTGPIARRWNSWLLACQIRTFEPGPLATFWNGLLAYLLYTGKTDWSIRAFVLVTGQSHLFAVFSVLVGPINLRNVQSATASSEEQVLVADLSTVTGLDILIDSCGFIPLMEVLRGHGARYGPTINAVIPTCLAEAFSSKMSPVVQIQEGSTIDGPGIELVTYAVSTHHTTTSEAVPVAAAGEPEDLY